MISYFDSKKPHTVTLDEAINYIEMVEKYKNNPELKKITEATNKLSSSNSDSFAKEFETKMTQNYLLPLDFETLTKLKDIFEDKNHHFQEAIDETIKQKTHILKNLYTFAKDAADIKFGSTIKGFLAYKNFNENDIKIKKDGEVKNFSKKSEILFSYENWSDKLSVEGVDVRQGGDVTRISFKNGNLDVRNDLNTIEHHLNKKPSRKITP